MQTANKTPRICQACKGKGTVHLKGMLKKCVACRGTGVSASGYLTKER